MIESKVFHNIKCDCCGCSLSEEWYDNPTDDSCWELMLQESDWLVMGKKHYCPSCYEIDDNDEYVPKVKKE